MNKEQDINSLTRFSNRVDNYVKYRPHYPKEIIVFLQNECGLTSSSVIADIGSGTGISTELFIEKGNKVYAVEPNKDMRKAAEQIYIDDKNFASVDSKAEATTLESKIIDIIVSGQAFHWFDKEKCKEEFKRILKTNGYVVLMWNLRDRKSAFMNDYENVLIKYGKDYEKLYQDDVDETEIRDFFAPAEVKINTFSNFQELNYDSLKGRLLSSSYIPLEDNPLYVEMLQTLENIFDEKNMNGKVKMEYETKVYYGKLNDS